MRRATLLAGWLALLMTFVMAAAPAAARTSLAGQRGRPPAQTAPTVAATPKGVGTPVGVGTPAGVGTAAVDLGAAATAGAAETPGEILAAWIILGVAGALVAVTAFLVWRTRPKR